MEGDHGTVERNGGAKAAPARPAARPSPSTTVPGSLQRRYELSYRTRFQGYEGEGPAMFYSSVLSDGPVAFVDRVVIKAPISSLPLPPGYWHMLRTKRKGRTLEYYLDSPYRVPGFVVHVGSTRAGQHLYFTCHAIPLRRSIPSVFADGLAELALNGVLDLGTPKSRREKAYALLRRFTVSELELRVDLDRRAGKKLMAQLGEYRDERGDFKLSCWEYRHTSGQQLKLYDKSEPVVRVEAVLYSKLFAPWPPSAVLSTPRVTFERWWPPVLKKIEAVRNYGHKPKLTHMLEAVDRWVPFADRVRDLKVGDMAERMIRRGRKDKLF